MRYRPINGGAECENESHSKKKKRKRRNRLVGGGMMRLSGSEEWKEKRANGKIKSKAARPEWRPMFPLAERNCCD